MNTPRLSLLALALLACAARAAAPPATPTVSTVTAPPVAVPCVETARPTPPVTRAPTAPPEPPYTPPRELASTRGDLDVDGTIETIKLYSDGGLRVFHGDQELTDANGNIAGMLVPFELDTLSNGAPRLEVVDIDRSDRQRELMIMESHGDEDPDGEFSFWVYRERRFWSMLRRVSYEQRAVAMHQGARPVIAGDGTVVVRRDHCVRDADAERHIPGLSERSTFRYVLTDGVMPRAELMENLRTERFTSQCIMAACPVVRVGAGAEAVGEILRDLRGASLERWQPLTIPASRVDTDGWLTVTLREEKHEVTHVDGVYLDVDGVRVEPEGCASNDAPAWCVADGARTTLPPGQSIRMRFRVGAAREVTLWATGYYDPLRATELEVRTDSSP
jgi:hypothetical protein